MNTVRANIRAQDWQVLQNYANDAPRVEAVKLRRARTQVESPNPTDLTEKAYPQNHQVSRGEWTLGCK